MRSSSSEEEGQLDFGFLDSDDEGEGGDDGEGDDELIGLDEIVDERLSPLFTAIEENNVDAVRDEILKQYGEENFSAELRHATLFAVSYLALCELVAEFGSAERMEPETLPMRRIIVALLTLAGSKISVADIENGWHPDQYSAALSVYVQACRAEIPAFDVKIRGKMSTSYRREHGCCEALKYVVSASLPTIMMALKRKGVPPNIRKFILSKYLVAETIAVLHHERGEEIAQHPTTANVSELFSRFPSLGENDAFDMFQTRFQPILLKTGVFNKANLSIRKFMDTFLAGKAAFSKQRLALQSERANLVQYEREFLPAIYLRDNISYQAKLAHIVEKVVQACMIRGGKILASDMGKVFKSAYGVQHSLTFTSGKSGRSNFATELKSKIETQAGCRLFAKQTGKPLEPLPEQQAGESARPMLGGG